MNFKNISYSSAIKDKKINSANSLIFTCIFRIVNNNS